MSNRLKELLKHVADKTIVRMVTFVASRVGAGHRNVIEVIIENALVDSAEYADSHMRRLFTSDQEKTCGISHFPRSSSMD